MSISPAEITSGPDKNRLLQRWLSFSSQREEQVFLALTLLIGALVGLAVVAFIVLTEHMGMRLYPVGSDPWRRVLIPVAGSLAMGYLLARYFGRRHFSVLYGLPWTAYAIGGATGPLWIGHLYDRAGSYLPRFIVYLAAVAFAAVILSLFLQSDQVRITRERETAANTVVPLEECQPEAD